MLKGLSPTAASKGITLKPQVPPFFLITFSGKIGGGAALAFVVLSVLSEEVTMVLGLLI